MQGMLNKCQQRKEEKRCSYVCVGRGRVGLIGARNSSLRRQLGERNCGGLRLDLLGGSGLRIARARSRGNRSVGRS